MSPCEIFPFSPIDLTRLLRGKTGPNGESQFLPNAPKYSTGGKVVDKGPRGSPGSPGWSTGDLFGGRTGRVVAESGQNRFAMPHGLTVDESDNDWLTDSPYNRFTNFLPIRRGLVPLWAFQSSQTSLDLEAWNSATKLQHQANRLTPATASRTPGASLAESPVSGCVRLALGRASAPLELLPDDSEE